MLEKELLAVEKDKKTEKKNISGLNHRNNLVVCDNFPSFVLLQTRIKPLGLTWCKLTVVPCLLCLL